MDKKETDVKKICHYNKGEIYICNLDEDNGDKQFFSSSGLIGKSRPCMIFSTREYNDSFRNTYTVIPIKTNNTEKSDEEYIRTSPDVFVPIVIDGDEKLLMVNQARPLKCQRIQSYIGTIVNQEVLAEVDRSYLSWHFGDESKIADMYDKYKNTENIINFLCSKKAKTCYDHWVKEQRS